MKRLLMMIGAAAIAAMADVALATDLDSYLFRYDFSSGAKVFRGSTGFSVDPLSDTKLGDSDRADMKVLSVDGPNGADSAVHPINVAWSAGSSSANSTTIYQLLSEGDWTFAMSVRPGTTHNGVLFSMGRRSADNRKGISICASSNPNEMIVDENIRVATNKKSQRSCNVLNNGVDVSRGFHTVVIVYRKPATGNAGTAEFYIDGVYQKSIVTADYVFGGGFQFCSTCSGPQGNEVSTETDLDVAFRDVRFYPAAFTASDAKRYAALYPAGKLRKSAFVRAYGVNSINTGYLPKHTMRIAADFQYMEVAKQHRIFGSTGAAGNLLCFFYINSELGYSRCLHDFGSGWAGMRAGAGTKRGFVALDGPGNSGTLYYDGTSSSASLGAVPTQDSEVPLAIFAGNNSVEYGSTDYHSKSLVYSVGIDEGGTPVHFFAPHKDETLGACFKDIVTGVLRGESEASPSTALSYSDGFGSSADYKYENGTLYAKAYADAVNTAQGMVSVSAGGAALTPESDGGYWVAYNTTLTLAATPANEYLFDGWAGDMRAVSSGTASSATLTVKVDKALQFEARFTPSVIRHTNFAGDFAKRAQDFDVGDYVQTGLVAHFDGIRNAGADAPHSDDATTWANLVSGGAAATRKEIANPFTANWTSLGEWEDDCYVFRGKSYFELGDNLTLGKAATIQITAGFTPNSTKAAWYPCLLGVTGEDMDNAVYFNENYDSLAQRGYQYFKLLGKTTHGSGAAWPSGARSSINAIYDAENGRVSISTADGYRWQTANTTDSVGAKTYAIGTGYKTDTSSSKQRGMRAFVGRVSSVRIYTDVLTEEELEWNRIVDDARFSGKIDADFVVAENPRGLEGVEGAGDYMVNGSHTFTATNLTFGVFAWSPVGYALERWNEDSQTWEFVSDGAGASYTYVNSKANGKMRLSWIWTQTGAVKGGYDTDDYIQDGLLLHFDGIRNAGADAPHSDDATTWANLGSLGGGKNATLTALASSIPSGATDGAWGDGGYRFGGKQYFAIGGTVALGGALTVQIAADYEDKDQLVLYPAFFGQTSNKSDNFMVYFNRNNGDDAKKKTPYFKLLDKTTHGAKSTWSGPFATAIYDKSLVNGVSIGNATLPEWQKRNASGDIPEYSYAIGTTKNSDAQRGAERMLVGTVKSVRVYNRVLPDFALTHNRAIDEVRFNGNVTIVNGAIGETGAAGACSVSGGEYDVSSGTWTITADRVVSDGHMYLPRLTIEKFTDGEWSQTERIWTKSYTVDASALGSDRIRLTWTWEISPGFMLIFQ